MGKRINAPKNLKRQGKRHKKLKGNKLVHQLVRDIETSQWVDKTLTKATKMKSIIALLTTLNTAYPNNPIVEHAIIKWEDKFNRNGGVSA